MFKEEEFNSILYTVLELLKADNQNETFEVLKSGEITSEQTHYDNWNGGIYFYTLYITIDAGTYINIKDRVEKIESDILEKFSFSTKHITDEVISKITIVPKAKSKIDWNKLKNNISKESLLKDIEYLKNIMISVSTGGQRIQDVNDLYKSKYITTSKALDLIDFKNPNPYKDLWEWYGKWSSTFPKYIERRAFINEMFNTLISQLEEKDTTELVSVSIDLTDWERIERSINEIKIRQVSAQNEEQCQVVGLLCRETIISIAQAVYNPEKHPITDNISVSKTDAKRMLEAYISVELSGSSNESLRKYAKVTLDLANELTHKRTATKKDVSICATATISLLNIIGTIEGRI